MTDERRERILQIAQELEEQGLEATNSAVYSRALGHRGDIVTVMRDRRAERGNGTTLVAEDEDDTLPQPTAAELAEDLQQLDDTYQAWHLAWERILELEQEGPLSEQHFSRKQWLEYQMAQNLQAQGRLQSQLAMARLTESVYAGRDQHDAGCAEAKRLAEATTQAVAALETCLSALALHVDTQIDRLALIRSRDGHQQFPLPGGREEVRNLLGRLYPGDFRAANLVDMLLMTALTHGRRDEALSEFARSQPFPPRLIEHYIASLEGVTP